MRLSAIPRPVMVEKHGDGVLADPDLDLAHSEDLVKDTGEHTFEAS